MAYFTDQYPGLFGDEDAQNSPFQAPGGAVGASFAPGQGSGPVARPAAPGGAGGGVPGSKFVNFDRLMAANRDSAQKTAQDVVGGVATAAQAAETANTAYGRDPADSGADPTKLWSDTLGAQQQVNALGSDEGYRALIDRRGGGSQGARDFTAALSGGFARQNAADLASRYGGMTERLTKTMADNAKLRASDRAQNDINTRAPTAAPAPTAPSAADAQDQRPELHADGRYYDRVTGQVVQPRPDQMDDTRSPDDAPVTAVDAGEGTRAIGQDRRAMYELGNRYWDWLNAGQPDLDSWKASQGIA